MKTLLRVCILSLVASTLAWADPAPKSPTDVCSRLNPDSAKTQCYNVIDRHEFDWYAAGVCDRYENSWQTVTCMRTIADFRFARAGLNECDSYVDAVVTNRCLDTIKGHYLQPNAVAACSRIPNAFLTTSCLAAIADKNYSAWEVQRCDGYSTGEGTIGCFQGLGKTASLDKAPDFNSALALLNAKPAEGGDFDDETVVKTVKQPSTTPSAQPKPASAVAI